MENNKNEHGITVTRRDLPPAHFTLKIESFSLLRNTGVKKYESDVFEAGGYKWRLCLNPNGKRFVSLYLKLENTSNFRSGWEVNADFKLFVYDHINRKYLAFQETLLKDTLSMTAVAFGAEVFVIRPTGKRELLSMVQKPANGSSTLKFEHFSKLDKNSPSSKVLTAGGRSWQIDVYPGGYGEGKGNSLTVYLGLVGRDRLPPKKAIWAECKLRVLNQRRGRGNHVEHTVRHWFTSSSPPFGFHSFMPLGHLQSSMGYLLNDTLIVEAEFLTLSHDPISERDLPPTHCSLKIESFSLFLETKDEKYEGGVFEAGGYKCNYCCTFGAMISVIKPTRKWELLSMVMKDFFKSDKSSCFSKAFTAGVFWRIKAYPKGNSEAKGDSPSIYLELVEAGILTLSVSKLFS
uniref:MATH domain-containing protein n=1 Tax=Salix viminalis TaxID=40686 RepID=A0A6N2MSA9_SALVM